MNKLGILLSNLGTPDAPTPKSVRRYLKEFLSDPYVVDKPRWLWLPILYGIILNIRPKISAAKYQKIWQANGSPLLIYSEQLKEKLQAQLPDVKISLGMRYGKPSLAQAINELSDVDELIVLPLYPQYSFSTSKSTIETIKNLLKKTKISKINFIEHYYDHPLYISAIVNSIKNFWQEHGRAQKLIFSFHGLPQSMIAKGDPYFDQCKKTVNLIAQYLNLSEKEYIISFQSRLGVEKWLQPYTMEVMQNLPKQGVHNIQVICPGFAADCLETLEEINIENRRFFLDAGGKEFNYIPCLNDQLDQIKFLTGLVLKDK